MGCGQCRPWKAVGEEGGIQGAWWLGGEEAQKGLKLAGGEQATAVWLLPFCRPSEARSLENMASASGKLGGVAGVLLGVHICGQRAQVWGCGEPFPERGLPQVELAFRASPRPDPKKPKT